jgi:hypothetical protein
VPPAGTNVNHASWAVCSVTYVMLLGDLGHQSPTPLVMSTLCRLPSRTTPCSRKSCLDCQRSEQSTGRSQHTIGLGRQRP